MIAIALLLADIMASVTSQQFPGAELPFQGMQAPPFQEPFPQHLRKSIQSRLSPSDGPALPNFPNVQAPFPGLKSLPFSMPETYSRMSQPSSLQSLLRRNPQASAFDRLESTPMANPTSNLPLEKSITASIFKRLSEVPSPQPFAPNSHLKSVPSSSPIAEAPHHLPGTPNWPIDHEKLHQSSPTTPNRSQILERISSYASQNTRPRISLNVQTPSLSMFESFKPTGLPPPTSSTPQSISMPIPPHAKRSLIPSPLTATDPIPLSQVEPLKSYDVEPVITSLGCLDLTLTPFGTISETSLPDPSIPLPRSPFLPAASPVSALAPPMSPLLPSASPSALGSNFLRKVPVPPPFI